MEKKGGSASVNISNIEDMINMTCMIHGRLSGKLVVAANFLH